jgi:hypothetical protein
MPGKPHQSCLIPYEDEILALRRKRPPMAYYKIAGLLLQKYNVSVQGPAIFKFLKVRKRGRKVFGYALPSSAKESAPASKKPQPATSGPSSSSKPLFEFQYSQRYNLKHLPPEEAAAIRKELEEKGH